MNDAFAITKLLYRYAELMDLGDLEGGAALFANATIHMSGDVTLHGLEAMLALWRSHVRLHSCGTPRTKHVITNPIVEFDDGGKIATCRSYYTVLQAAPGVPLQVVGAGRYHDRFERADGAWRFTERDYSLFDLKGDLSQYLLAPAAG